MRRAIAAVLLISACAPAPLAATSSAPASLAPPSTAVPSPTIALTPSPSPTPSAFVLTGAVTYAGRPVRAAVNVFASAPDFCAKWSSGAFNSGGSVGSVTVGEVGFGGLPAGAYRFTLPPGTYVVIVSPRVNPPGGNWFYAPGGPVPADPTSCASASTRITLDHDTTADAAFR